VKALPTAEIAFQPRSGLHAPELIAFLSLSEAEFRQRFRASPILRAKRRGFLRNVAVALGNLKALDAVPALIRSLDDEESVVRGHVAWALGQIGAQTALDPLHRRLRAENDADVQEELRQAIGILSGDSADLPVSRS
jgi:epoxyqueuosine reductase